MCKGVSEINIKQEIGNSKAKIKKIKNQISSCHDKDLKIHLYYQLQQEEIKLESFELLLALYQKVGKSYE